MNTISEMFNKYSKIGYSRLKKEDADELYIFLKNNYRLDLTGNQKVELEQLIDIYQNYHYSGKKPVPIHVKAEKYNRCSDKEIRQYLEDLKDDLKNYTIFDIRTKEDHIEYLQMVKRFRDSLAELEGLKGENYSDLLRSLLSSEIYQGDDLRFIFELIQNVDDCFYLEGSGRSLSVEFNYDSDPSTITLTYNEAGFEPSNVYAITGIAEAAKNIGESKKKIEIGEKGIGFKSVFGIADKVHIESGWFSFILKKGTYTQPILAYEDYEQITGTRLTLYLEKNACKSLFDKYIGRYKDKRELLSKNPILFLNELTNLKVFSKDSYLEFDVERKSPVSIDGICKEDNIQIRSTYIADRSKIETKKTSHVIGDRYEKSISYDYEKCISRYGPKTQLQERELSLVAIFPKIGYGLDTSKGSLYSYLPMDVPIPVPLVVHAPFKLDSARLHIDSQGKNLWFQHTASELRGFLINCYKDLSNSIKIDNKRANILRYLPHYDKLIIDSPELKGQGFGGKTFCDLPIVPAVDGIKKAASSLMSFDHNFNNPELACKLLGIQGDICLPPGNLSMKDYGGGIRRYVSRDLFIKALTKEIKKEDRNAIFDWLENEKEPIDYGKIFNDNSRLIQSVAIYNLIERPWAKDKLIVEIFEYAVYNQELFSDIVKWVGKDRPPFDYTAILDTGHFAVTADTVEVCIDYGWLQEALHKKLFQYALVHPDYFLRIINALDDKNIEDFRTIIKYWDTRWKVPPEIINSCFNTDKTWIVELLSQRLIPVALNDQVVLGKLSDWLERTGVALDFTESLAEQKQLLLTMDSLNIIAASEKLRTVFSKFSENAIKHGKIKKKNASSFNNPYIIFENSLPTFIIPDNLKNVNTETRKIFEEAVSLSNVSEKFKKYFLDTNKVLKCIDAEEDFALAAGNGIVLSDRNLFKSFGNLTSSYDDDKTLVARMIMQGASADLDKLTVNCSDPRTLSAEFKENYFKKLIDVRTLSNNRFNQKFIEGLLGLIEESSTDANRFLNELIQNADDLLYPEGETPTFIAKIDGDIFSTWTNEIGFGPGNLRAITSIGESTKKRLLSTDGSYRETGEKGIGFKSVFRVSEKVEIHSNGFDFILTKEKPTIPVKCKPISTTDGTSMFFSLTENIKDRFDGKEILQIVACLHRLKHLEILGTVIDITDTEGKRVITFNNDVKYGLDVLEKHICIPQEIADERKINGKEFSTDQILRLYAPWPKSAGAFRMYLYNALPVKKIYSNAPLIIDAPFQLVTDRTDIYNSKWSGQIRKEVTTAILDFMEKRSYEILDVLRFTSYNADKKIIEPFNSRYLSEEIDWCKEIRSLKILPEICSNLLLSAREPCIILPDFITEIYIKEKKNIKFGKHIIDVRGKSHRIPILNHLGVNKANPNEITQCLLEITPAEIYEEQFRSKLYDFIKNKKGNYEDSLCSKLPIVPVISENNKTTFIKPPGKVYYCKSDPKYDSKRYILDERIMNHKEFVELFNSYSDIEELNDLVLKAEYSADLERYIKYSQESLGLKATYLLKEYYNNPFFAGCQSVLRGLRELIPTKMKGKELGKNVYRKGKNRFLNKTNVQFKGEIIPKLLIDDEYVNFAKFIGFDEDILDIYYDSIDIQIEHLSDLDIEDLMKGFNHYYDLFTSFIADGLISPEQIEKYDLEFADKSQYVREDGYEEEDEEFPHDGCDINRIKSSIERQWADRNPYVSTQVIEWNPKVNILKERDEYSRSMYWNSYRTKLFCQRCEKTFSEGFIKREEIEKEPKYAWKQMWLTLCLYCAKEFETFKKSDQNMKVWINNLLKNARYAYGNAEVDFEDTTIKFTKTHLEEVKAILKIEGYPNSQEKRK